MAPVTSHKNQTKFRWDDTLTHVRVNKLEMISPFTCWRVHGPRDTKAADAGELSAVITSWQGINYSKWWIWSVFVVDLRQTLLKRWCVL